MPYITKLRNPESVRPLAVTALYASFGIVSLIALAITATLYALSK